MAHIACNEILFSPTDDTNGQQVVMFVRRCGLKRYTPRFRYFNVDGALLMTFDPDDFRLLGVKNPVLVKKVRARFRLPPRGWHTFDPSHPSLFITGKVAAMG